LIIFKHFFKLCR